MPKIVESKNILQIKYESEGKNSVYMLTIEYADKEEKGSRSKTGFKENKTIIEFYNYKLEDIIVSLLGLSQSKIEVIGKSLNTSLIIGFKVETALMKFKKSKSLLIDILCKTFSFEIKKQTIEKEGWSMTCPNEQLLESYNIPKNQKVSSSMSSNSQEWIGTQITINVLQKALENQFNVIVFDDTDLAYHYDFRFPLKNKKSAKEYLEKEYGIILNNAIKPVEITVLDFENKIK
ncbi:MAG: DUF3738 domain-containing protein [Bacteroidetes bacterium]|nr:DUF3738 domain-containing protein [Bacteroidota bacterium]